VQVVGLGWRNYWKNMWNKFDCILLVTGLVDMAVTLAVGESRDQGDIDGVRQGAQYASQQTENVQLVGL
jgi:hypothetical protein